MSEKEKIHDARGVDLITYYLHNIDTVSFK